MLAVSGGIDSVAMAALFAEAGYDFAIIHCNFKLREAESDADEKFVKELAGKCKVPFYSKSFNTQEIAKGSGDSIQMVARDLRYDYFEETAFKEGYDYIATAHHLDDQTETFFINLLRGCGIAGLHGIKLKNGNIIRPMMFAFRKDIESFVIDNGISYREDRSNSSLNYLRNKVRHQLIPLFTEMNSAFAKEMQGNISVLADTEKVFKDYVKIKGEELISKDGDTLLIDLDGLKKLEPVNIYLYEFIAPYGFMNNDVNNILAAIKGIPGKRFYSATHQLLIDRKQILIQPLKESIDVNDEYLIREEDRLISLPIKLMIRVEPNIDFTIPQINSHASLDFKKLKFPLKLRHWQKGDGFIPLGMKNRKKLSDFFIDEKFSIFQKESAWVLCSSDDIIWIVGHRIDERYKIRKDTERVYSIELK